LSLPARMPSVYDIVAVTTIRTDQLPQPDIANLERLRVYVVPPINRETLEISMPRLSVKPPDTQLTPPTKGEAGPVPHDGQPLIYQAV